MLIIKDSDSYTAPCRGATNLTPLTPLPPFPPLLEERGPGGEVHLRSLPPRVLPGVINIRPLGVFLKLSNIVKCKHRIINQKTLPGLEGFFVAPTRIELVSKV